MPNQLLANQFYSLLLAKYICFHHLKGIFEEKNNSQLVIIGLSSYRVFITFLSLVWIIYELYNFLSLGYT